jgi:hypothetical protein
MVNEWGDEMILKLPQEIEVWYIIPALRRELARELLKRGLRQREIARKLGVTDAAVSQYFSSKRGTEVKFNEGVIREVSAAADKIMKGQPAMPEIQRLCRMCKSDGICCYIHKHQGAPENCKVCFPERGDSDEKAVS